MALTRRGFLGPAAGATLIGIAGCTGERGPVGTGRRTGETSRQTPTETSSREAGSGSWPQFGAGPRNTGHAADASGPGPTDAEVAWRFDAGTPTMNASPVVGDGTVYVAASSTRVCVGVGGGESNCSGVTRGRLYAVGAANGDRQWTAEIETDTRSSPAVVGDTVYVGCRDGLSAVTTDGEPAWRVTFESDGEDDPYVDSSPAVADGQIFVGASDGRLRAIRSVDGA